MESTRIVSPSVDSTCRKSICARLRKYSWSGLWGWVENVVDSSRFDRIDWSLWPRFKNEEGSCIVISRILTSGGLCRVGWKCCRFESIRSNRHESYESTEVCGHVLRTRKVHVSLFHGSWLPVDYAGWVENVADSTRFDLIRSNRH